MRINDSKPLQAQNTAKEFKSTAGLSSETESASAADSFASVTRPAQDGIIVDLVNEEKQAAVAKAKLGELSMNYLAKSTEINTKIDRDK